MPADPDNNGSRIDRIERVLERVVTIQADHDQRLGRNEAAISDLIQLHKRTLGIVEGLANQVVHLAGRMDELAQAQKHMDEKLAELSVKVAETSGKLDALIDVVDGIVRRQPPPQPAA